MNEHFDRIEDIFEHRFDSKDAQERCADAVGPLLAFARYCQKNVIENLPSIAREIFTQKLTEIIRECS